MSAIDGKTGKLKKSEEQITYDVAGPLCFQVLLTSSIYSLRGELREGALDSNSFFYSSYRVSHSKVGKVILLWW